MRSNLIVTDVTRMAIPKVCVAGLLDNGACARPLLGSGDLDEGWLCQHPDAPTQPFAVIAVTVVDRSYRERPHVEDCRIAPAYGVVRLLDAEERRSILQRTAEGGLSELFGTPLLGHGRSRWVAPGSGTRSLATLKPSRVLGVELEKAGQEPAKARLRFVDAAAVEFSAPVTDLQFRLAVDRIIDTGLATLPLLQAVITERLRRAEVWLRLGLTRPYDRDGSDVQRCYLQVNGIYAFPDYLRTESLADELVLRTTG